MMKLAVTTSYSVLCVDPVSGEVSAMHRGRGLYYGLARNDSAIVVGARNRMVSSADLPENEKGALLFFDRNFVQQAAIQPDTFALRDIHEIGWMDESLWVTCSYDNMVAIWDGGKWERWFPLGMPQTAPLDINHFNSFLFEGDSLWLVAHNKGASEILRFHRKTRELEERMSLGNQAHNLWRENGNLYTCSSGEGAIVGTDGFRLETGGFPRGVAFGDGLRCVGISELAERATRDLTTPRIAIFDDRWRRVSELALPNEGLILDIQVLDDIQERQP